MKYKIQVSLLFLFLSVPAFSSYKVQIDDSPRQARLVLNKDDLEAGLIESQVTDQEIQNFLSQLTNKRAKLLAKLYQSECMDEIRLGISQSGEYSEMEVWIFIKERASAIPRSLGGGAAIAFGYLGINFIVQKYTTELPAFFQSSIPSLAVGASVAVLSPLLTPIVSRLTQLTFNLKKMNRNPNSSEASNKFYQIWMESSTNYPMTAEMARNTLLAAHNFVTSKLNEIAIDLGNRRAAKIEEDEYSFITRRVASVILLFQAHFRDVKAQDFGLDLTVKNRLIEYRSLLVSQPFKEDLRQEVFVQSQYNHLQYDEEVVDFVISAWIPQFSSINQELSHR